MFNDIGKMFMIGVVKKVGCKIVGGFWFYFRKGYIYILCIYKREGKRFLKML